MPTGTPNKKTAASWKAQKRHPITLPSGMEIQIEIPNLPLLVKTGQLPNDLVTEALAAVQGGQMTPEVLIKQSDFYDKLVSLCVKEPAVTEEDVHELPFEDVELICEIATRQRDLDAVGHHVGGLHTSKEWRQFRGLDYSDEAMARL